MSKTNKVETLAKKSAQDQDQVSNFKTIYDVPYREIVLRNFTAGVSRGLGGFIFSLTVLAILGAFYFQYVQPTITSVANSLETTADFFTSVQIKAASSWWGGGGSGSDNNSLLNSVLQFVPSLLKPRNQPTEISPTPIPTQ